MGDQSAPKLTRAQVTLLRAVAEGKVDHLGGHAFHGTIDGRWRKLDTRVRTLDKLGLIDPYGVAMKRGQPMPPDERFPDYHVVTLTPAGRQALGAAALRVAPVEWDGTALAGLPHGTPLLRRGRLQAASRDASWLDRPDVHSIKARHVAVASHEVMAAGGMVAVAAACDPRRIMLAEDLIADATTVHPNGQCRRAACRALFQTAHCSADETGAHPQPGSVR